MQRLISKKGRGSGQKAARIIFAAESTEYLRGPERAFRGYISTIYDQAISLADYGSLYDVNQRLVAHSADRRKILREVISECVNNAIASEEISVLNSILSTYSRRLVIGKSGRIYGAFSGLKTDGSALKYLITSESKSRIYFLAQNKPEWAILYYNFFDVDDLQIFYKYKIEMFERIAYMEENVNSLFSLFDYSFYTATNQVNIISAIFGGGRASVLRKELASEVMEYFFEREIMVSMKNIFAPGMYLDIYGVFQMGRKIGKPDKMEIFGLLIRIDQHKWASRFKNIYKAGSLRRIREFAVSRFQILKKSKNVSEGDLRYLGRLFGDLGVTNEFMS